VPLLNKAGGAGFQVTAYTQTWSDVEARIGSRAKAGQVAGNFNTMLMLRVKELDTAEMLTEQLPRVEVFTLMSVSGVDDSSDPGSGVDFKSRNEDRISVSEVPMLTAADMVTLPKGQAFALYWKGASSGKSVSRCRITVRIRPCRAILKRWPMPCVAATSPTITGIEPLTTGGTPSPRRRSNL
jgi:hypothetical protein